MGLGLILGGGLGAQLLEPLGCVLAGQPVDHRVGWTRRFGLRPGRQVGGLFGRRRLQPGRDHGLVRHGGFFTDGAHFARVVGNGLKGCDGHGGLEPIGRVVQVQVQALGGRRVGLRRLQPIGHVVQAQIADGQAGLGRRAGLGRLEPIGRFIHVEARGGRGQDIGLKGRRGGSGHRLGWRHGPQPLGQFGGGQCGFAVGNRLGLGGLGVFARVVKGRFGAGDGLGRSQLQEVRQLDGRPRWGLGRRGFGIRRRGGGGQGLEPGGHAFGQGLQRFFDFVFFQVGRLLDPQFVVGHRLPVSGAPVFGIVGQGGQPGRHIGGGGRHGVAGIGQTAGKVGFGRAGGFRVKRHRRQRVFRLRGSGPHPGQHLIGGRFR